jgi:hypothetical protein
MVFEKSKITAQSAAITSYSVQFLVRTELLALHAQFLTYHNTSIQDYDLLTQFGTGQKKHFFSRVLHCMHG